MSYTLDNMNHSWLKYEYLSSLLNCLKRCETVEWLKVCDMKWRIPWLPKTARLQFQIANELIYWATRIFQVFPWPHRNEKRFQWNQMLKALSPMKRTSISPDTNVEAYACIHVLANTSRGPLNWLMVLESHAYGFSTYVESTDSRSAILFCVSSKSDLKTKFSSMPQRNIHSFFNQIFIYVIEVKCM